MNDMHQAHFPLTTAQLEIWLAEALTPGTAQYNIAEYLEIHGPVDPVLFEVALRQVVGEAESLHLGFTNDDGDGPRQILGRTVDWPFPVVDISAEPDPQAAAESWMQADLAKPRDLIGGPLFAYALFRAGSNRFFWYQRNHHLLMDGFGGGLIARRLADVYTAMVEGREPEPSPFGPFQDLLAADAEYRISEVFLRDRQYWQERFADRPDPVSLAGRRVPASGILRRQARLSPETSTALRELARDAGTTLPQLLTALAVAYLHRMTGTTDLVVGSPVTGRTGRAMRTITGTVSNVVPLRLAVGAELTLKDLLGQVGRELRRALRHQRYRSEDLRRDLGLGTDRQLYATMVNIEPFDYELRFAGHETSARNLANGPSRDLDIYVFDRGPSHSLGIAVNANAALYDAEEVAAHQGRLIRLLDAIVADPGQRIGSIELLEPEERQRLLVEWNDTARPVPESTLPALFEAQAARTPDAAALVFEEEALSYADLNARANRLAHRLIALGAGPETLVGLCLERSVEMVVGLLAILKAGAAYLPLDPDYPEERLGFMLEDARPAVLVTTAGLSHRLATDAPRLLLDDPDVQAGLAEGPDTNPADAGRSQPLLPHHPAYVIYTSGSTGKPKGVVVSRTSLDAFLAAAAAEAPLAPDDRLLAVTTIGFDIAGLELFLPLIRGARIILAGRETVRDPTAMARLIAAQGATTLQATPSFWQGLVEAQPQALAGLQVLVGGEALPRQLAGRLAGLSGRGIVNLYGPTEATIWATAARIEEAFPGEPSIGRPLANDRVHVLDGSLRPVP
ncbi:MAG: AMP-binding protein, partial [Inquilinus sp.]|uniref:AMP-binding protein n=1 Tax=Inquilinus sp. TaxID=1932117 RepID=UPI003F4130AC